LQDRTTVDEGKAVLLPAPGAATVPAHPTWRDYLVLFALACGPALSRRGAGAGDPRKAAHHLGLRKL